MDDQRATTLVHLARSGDLTGYATALAAVPVQQLTTIGKTADFQQSVELLVPIARGAKSSADRLAALALIGRADSTTQQKYPAIADAARRAVREQAPSIATDGQALGPDDRHYLALVIARADADWVVPYAARALVDEGGEPRLKNDVRTAYATLLFDRCSSLQDTFAALRDAIPGSQHEQPGTKEPDLSRAKRLAKLLPVIDDATRRAMSDSGAQLLPAFNAALQALIFRHRRPAATAEGDDAAASVVESALLLLSTLLRTRFVLAVETDAYLAVGRLRYWHKTEGWPKTAASARKRLNQTLIQAIALRAQAGSPSRELLAVTVQLAGDRRRVEAQLAAIADQPGIAPEVQDWLRAGGRQTAPRYAPASGGEAGLRDTDALLGAAALRANHLLVLADRELKASLSTMRLHPALGEDGRVLTQGLAFSRALATDVLSLAKRRSLTLFGVPGDVVDAVPDRHRREDGKLIETAKVRIERPGIERQLPNGTPEVILPAMVAEVEGKRK